MENHIQLNSCMPVIPSADLEKSLHFWIAGLGLTRSREMHEEGKLVGCMVHNEHVYFWLNRRSGPTRSTNGYEGIRLYWAPTHLHEIWERLQKLGYAVSPIEKRDYGQTEFLVTDPDGFIHVFGVASSL